MSKTIKFLFISTILFIVFSFSPISINLNELSEVSKTYAVSNLTQEQLDQTASILSSIQSIINKLKIDIQTLFGREAKAATETIGLVRQDCTGYSNCYTSLSAWEAAYGGINFGACAQGDLVCADKIAIAQIDGAWTSADTTAVIIDGWTTDATHYIKIYTTAAARHNGKWDTGKYRLEAGPQWAYLLNIVENNVRIDGLQVYHSYSGVSGVNGGVNFNGEATGHYYWEIKNSIVKLNESSTLETRNAIFFDNTSSNVTAIVINNIVYDCLRGIQVRYGISGTSIVYNNTVINCSDRGIEIGRDAPALGTVRLKNNIVQGASSIGNYVISSNLSTLDTATNLSQDATSPNVSLRSKTVSFVDSTNKDFHLSSADTSAKDAGTNLSADANLAFSDDIDGNTRPVGSAWDMGADEESTVVPPADTTPPVLSSGSPTGALPAGTTQTTLSLTTADENSTCKYGTIPNTAYASIANTFTTTGGTSHSQTITGLTNGTSYNYYIRCSDATGNANTADYTISFSVSAPAGDTTPPTVSITSPTNGTTVSGTITITANATDNTGVAGVQFKLDNSNIGTEDITSPYFYSFNTTATTNGSHTLTAVARDTSNNYATSSGIAITVSNAGGTTDTQAPTTPINLTATAVSSSQINLSWSASTDNVGVTGYKIYRCAGSACAPIVQIAISNITSYSNTGLTAGTVYTYAVSAYDAAGNESGKSGSAMGTTLAQIGVNITGISGTATNELAITITGSGFGVNGPNILLFDDFEGGTNGNIIKSGNGSATIGEWDITGNGGNDPKYSNSHALSGTLAFRGDATKQYGSGPESISVAGRYITAASDIFVSYWYYFPSTSDWPCYDYPTYTSCNNKMVWITGINTTVDDRVIPVSMPTDKNTNDDYALFGNGAINSSYFTPFPMSKGKWHRFWVYLHGEGNANDHEELWVASPSSEANMSVTRKVDRSSQIWPSGFAGFKRAWVNAYQRWCNNCSESAPTFDDVYIATGVGARARVEIGDAATYATSKNLTIATVTSWSDTSITATIRQGSFTDGQTAYLYAVDANGNVNENGYLVTVGGVLVDTQPPAAPTDLNAQAISSSQINLSWTASTDNVGVTGYKIYRCAGSGCAPTIQIATSTVNSYSNIGLTASTAYTYAVSAYDAAGNESAKSSAISATTLTTTPQDITSPTISLTSPTNGATVSGTITVAASASDNIAVAGVQFKLDGANLGIEDITSPYSLSYNTTQTTNGSHTLLAIARDSSNNRATSSALTITVNNDLTAPVISNVATSTISTSTATISWTTSEPATSQVEYGLTTNYTASTTKDTALTTSHSMLLTNLSPNTTYNFRVLSEDGSNNKALSVNYSFKTTGLPDTTPPSPTTDLKVQNITQTSADLLTWTAQGDDGSLGTAYEFDIRYTTGDLSANNWNNGGIIKATGEPTPKPAGSQMSYTLVGLTANTTYKIALKTLDEAGNQSPISNIITFTTLAAQTTPPPTPAAPSSGGGGGGGSSSGGGGGGGGGSSTLSDTTPPPQITNLESSGADKQTRLTWKNPDSSTDWVRTIVVRKEGSFATSTQDGQIVFEGQTQEFTDINLKNNENYYYSLFTIDRTPNYSKPVTVKVKTIALKVSLAEVKSAPLTVRAQDILDMEREAAEIIKSNIISFLTKFNFKRDKIREDISLKKYVSELIKGLTDLMADRQIALNHFIAYGTETTLKLGAGERAGVVNSYKSAFNKLPTTAEEWTDVIKIGNGRWPSQTSTSTEAKATTEFKKVYKRSPNRKNQHDDAAVTVMSYGLRPANRNLNSEKAAIKSFRAIYGYDPKSAIDWDIVRAVAYSGAKR